MISTKQIEVRYKETDQMGVVHHSNYIVWFELARVQYLKDSGSTMSEIEDMGYYMPVIDVYASYIKPVRLHDDVTISTYISMYSGVKIEFRYEVKNQNNEICVTGYSHHVFVTKDQFRAVRLKKTLPFLHEMIERAVVK